MYVGTDAVTAVSVPGRVDAGEARHEAVPAAFPAPVDRFRASGSRAAARVRAWAPEAG
jgi:hypothetical protein